MIKTIVISLICLPIGCTLVKAENQWTPEMEKEFQLRSQAALTKLTDSKYGTTSFESEKRSYPKAMIDFLAGNREKAISFLQSEDADSKSHAHTLGIDFYSGFTLKGQVRKYFYFGKYLDPSYRQRMKRAMQLWTEVDPLTRRFPNRQQFWPKDNCDTWVDCRNTDNLRAMREVSVYLFAEETGNEATRKLYKERIQRNVRILYQIGQGEWDSENYLGHTISTYVNLYDFAKDPEVKSLAKSVLDWSLTSGAIKYWRGGFGGPSKRDYNQGNCVWCSLATHELGLYFGDSPLADPNPSPDLVHLITSTYRPPSAVVALARKQFQKPLELLNSKPTYENWKPGGDAAPEFYETLYFGNTFQIGTLARGSGGDWNGFKMMAFNSKRGVDYFIAATGTDPTQISSSSIGGDRIAQYRNLIIWLNDRPNAPFQFFVPKSVKLETKKGVTFLGYEKTWLALTPINLKIEGINSAATEKIFKKYPDNQIITAMGNDKISGFALEIGEKETYGSWDKFQQFVLSQSRLNLSEISNKTVEYKGISGKVQLQHQSQGLPKVWRNGNLHDWRKHYAVYQNTLGKKTLIYQGWKQGTLEITAGGYNFTSSP
ncbi:hypothetical protein NUACC26_060110 [Scytonema sp. NUACC26]